MKKLGILFVFVALSLAIMGCARVRDLESIEFVNFPKTTYVVGEQLPPFSVEISPEIDGLTVLTHDHPRIIITGFNTDTPGTRTMVITVDGLEDASVSFVYTVVSSMTDLLFAGGSGTEQDPYQIANAQQLQNIRLALDSHFILINHIDLSGVVWEPIGDAAVVVDGGGAEVAINQAFSGVLDGAGYSIFNLTSDGYTVDITGGSVFTWDLQAEAFGLFVAIEGTAERKAVVKNLSLEFVDIDIRGIDVAYQYVGALAVFASHAELENLYTSGQIYADGQIGGYIGWYFSNSTLRNSVNNIDMVSTGLADRTVQQGWTGLAGFANQIAGTVTIENFVNNGNMTLDVSEPIPQPVRVGHLISQLQGRDASLEIINTSGTGTINVPGWVDGYPATDLIGNRLSTNTLTIDGITID